MNNYEKIATAIGYIQKHFKEQPDLDKIAASVHLSPFHFQRLFSEWAGVSPKKFLQYLTIEYAKGLLQEQQSTLFDTALESGLSGTSRLHDLFVSIEGMTPGEYKNGGRELSINYSFAESPFGEVLVASTPRGICHLAFADNREEALAALFSEFPEATYTQTVDRMQQNALYIFTRDWAGLPEIRLHLKGTPFQLKVWDALLKIPMGGLSTYSGIAHAIDNPKASRAVGSAVGDNPVAFLIPCHRVIKGNGESGNYHWGAQRKSAMIGWEGAKADRNN